jgi:hypothetical protein
MWVSPVIEVVGVAAQLRRGMIAVSGPRLARAKAKV